MSSAHIEIQMKCDRCGGVFRVHCTARTGLIFGTRGFLCPDCFAFNQTPDDVIRLFRKTHDDWGEVVPLPAVDPGFLEYLGQKHPKWRLSFLPPDGIAVENEDGKLLGKGKGLNLTGVARNAVKDAENRFEYEIITRRLDQAFSGSEWEASFAHFIERTPAGFVDVNIGVGIAHGDTSDEARNRLSKHADAWVEANL